MRANLALSVNVHGDLCAYVRLRLRLRLHARARAHVDMHTATNANSCIEMHIGMCADSTFIIARLESRNPGPHACTRPLKRARARARTPNPGHRSIYPPHGGMRFLNQVGTRAYTLSHM